MLLQISGVATAVDCHESVLVMSLLMELIIDTVSCLDLQVATATASFPLLLQCHPDVWAQVLLPKLIAQGSVGSVALACSTLRSMLQQRAAAQFQDSA